MCLCGLAAPVLLVAVLVGQTGAWPPPPQLPDSKNICETLDPQYSYDDMFGKRGPVNIPAPFTITLDKYEYRASETLTLTINATTTEQFNGYIIMARNADPSEPQGPVGYFNPIPGSKIICDTSVFGDLRGRENLVLPTTPGHALTHTIGSPGSYKEKSALSVKWTAPNQVVGHLVFWVTILGDDYRYWVGEKSAVVRDPSAPPLPVTERPKPDVGPIFTGITSQGCGTTKSCYRNPPNCAEEQCDILVTWFVHSNGYVDFELSADTEGWVAVGFSDDKKMGNDDVTECIWNEEESRVVVQKSFNNEDRKQNEVLEPPQVGLMYIDGYKSDGRIRCRFTRPLFTEGRTDIFDLNNEYHILKTRGDMDKENPAKKGIHVLSPFKYPYVTWDKVDLKEMQDIDGTTRYPLVKLHGILMLIAYMMCTSVGLIMAKYYKLMWPNDRCCKERVWFAVHRGTQVTCLVCTVIGFILIFIHTWGYSQMPFLPDKAHPILGIIVTILCVLNPLVALCRCKPKSRRRPIFNWIHWFIGTVCAVLAIPTMMIGLSLPKAHVPSWATWVVVAFMLFHLIIELLLEIHGCINGRKQKMREEEWELRKRSDPRGEYYGQEMEPVGTRFKKRVIAVYLVVVIVLGIVMIIAVASG